MKLRAALLAVLGAAVALPSGLGWVRSAGAQSPGENVPLESRWIGTVVPLRSGDRGLPLALYRSLIPAPYSMPATPMVGIYLVDLYAPHSTMSNQPWNDYDHWLEGGVDLAVSYHGEKGWYHLAMPVNSSFEYGLGRQVGFPKYHAGADFSAAGTGWRAAAYPATTGRLSTAISWRPSPGAHVPAALVAYTTQQQPFFSLNPALVGPEAERVSFTPSAYMPGSLPAPEPGIVHVQLEPNIDSWDNTLPHLFALRHATLADLIDLDQTVPGVMWHSQALYDIQSEVIGHGGYAKNAAAGYLNARQRGRRSTHRTCHRRRHARCRLTRRRRRRTHR